MDNEDGHFFIESKLCFRCCYCYYWGSEGRVANLHNECCNDSLASYLLNDMVTKCFSAGSAIWASSAAGCWFVERCCYPISLPIRSLRSFVSK